MSRFADDCRLFAGIFASNGWSLMVLYIIVMSVCESTSYPRNRAGNSFVKNRPFSCRCRVACNVFLAYVLILHRHRVAVYRQMKRALKYKASISIIRWEKPDIFLLSGGCLGNFTDALRMYFRSCSDSGGKSKNFPGDAIARNSYLSSITSFTITNQSSFLPRQRLRETMLVLFPVVGD
jgi:hypothetical protein